MLLPIRAAHPVANRGASGAVFWKDARHLAPSPWLLAVGWHRNVSFLFFFKTQMEREALEKSFNYLRLLKSQDWYLQTVGSDIKPRSPRKPVFGFLFEVLYEVLCSHLFLSLTGNPSQTWLCALARHSERPALRYSERALQDGDA